MIEALSQIQPVILCEDRVIIEFLRNILKNIQIALRAMCYKYEQYTFPDFICRYHISHENEAILSEL